MQDGVTIDLSQRNRLIVSRDETLTAVRPGLRWQDIYAKLEPMGLSVVGGRTGSVGVSGLILGGGNSYFAPRYGIACDNVVSYEVVLSSGRRVVANAQRHTDLFKALRGGGNNYGIVTQFILRTFKQGNIWGGFVVHPPNTTTENLQRLQAFNTASGNGLDRDATNNQVHMYDANGRSGVLNILVNTRPAESGILLPFSNLKPQISNDLRITNLSEIVEEGTPPSGARNTWASFSFANNATILAHVLDLADDAFKPLKPIQGFGAIFSFQAISREVIQHMSSHGGNVLGIDPNRNIFWLNYGVSYSNAADDELVYSTTRTLFEQVENYTRSTGQHVPFIYMNYALPTQKVIESYGQENVDFLRAVSRK
ncbi:MAG: hypothetical protein LQ337_001178 [Flavoplaca oasis]|nr:MAG: hypothetical protein LQ337_001178 [Flavoplaca oasis]